MRTKAARRIAIGLGILALITGCGVTQHRGEALVSANTGTNPPSKPNQGAAPPSAGEASSQSVQPSQMQSTTKTSEVISSPSQTSAVPGNGTQTTNAETGNNQTGSNTEQNSTGSTTVDQPSNAVVNLVPQVYSVAQGEVALTIDDGPSPYTESILQVLNQYHVNATFFFVGSRAKEYPAAVKDALSMGNPVGDHSESHPDFFRLSEQEQEDQIMQGAYDIEQVTGQPITLFRPPYGDFNRLTETALAKDHVALALWNRDPRDWESKSPQQIIQRVLASQPSGGVYDLHDTKLTLEALPVIIQALQKEHLKFVVLSAPPGMTGIAPGTGVNTSGH